MFFVLGDRNSLIQQLPKDAVWAQVGIYRGDFSQKILELCSPSAFNPETLSFYSLSLPT